MECSNKVAAVPDDKQSHSIFQFVDGFDMPSPFSGDIVEDNADQEKVVVHELTDISSLAQIAPPPECAHCSPHSTHSSHGSSSCISIGDSYIKGSSLSPVSSPNSSCTGDITLAETTINSISGNSMSPILTKDEFCSARKESEEVEGYIVHEQNVPKNIKLPQRKGGMQLWQFLYALLNDPEKKYNKLIEWTVNNLSREFRLLEPEAIAIWWGEHKNKKNMSYDKLSRSLRYYYDKGIIRKISGERYVYQFCIDPELMYKHIGNSDSRPKLKPMPQSAYHATSEYQSQHCFTTTCNLIGKDSCYVAQGPMSLGMMHSHLMPSRSAFVPPGPSYNSIPPFLTHGYSDINTDLHSHPSHLGLYNNSAFFPSPGYDSMSAIPSMTASLGYPPMEPQSPLKAHLPPLRKCHLYDVPGLTPVPHMKYENESSYGQSPLLHPGTSSQSVILSSNSLSPPPLTRNRVSSPITPSYTNNSSPLPPYSNHSSPHSFPGTNDDPLGFDGLMVFTSSDEYSAASGVYQRLVYSTCNNNSQHVSSTVDNTWE